jgi:hypothetical protein
VQGEGEGCIGGVCVGVGLCGMPGSRAGGRPRAMARGKREGKPHRGTTAALGRGRGGACVPWPAAPSRAVSMSEASAGEREGAAPG